MALDDERPRSETFASDVTPTLSDLPPSPAKPAEKVGNVPAPDPKIDGVIGQLELYQSGAVKMRLANGILLDVRLHTHHPSFFVVSVTDIHMAIYR